MKVKVKITQPCLTLCHPIDCRPPGSSVHGILQARILAWVAIPFSRGSCQPRDQTQVSCIAGGFFTVWATAMVLPVDTYGCKSWTLKKADHQRTDALELRCWIRLLRVPWTARRSNQSILKEINPEYSLEGLRLKLKLWYFDYLIQRADSLEKTLMLGKIEGRRRRGWQRIRRLDGITDSIHMNLSKFWYMVKDRESRACSSSHSHKESEHDWATEQEGTKV